jgi:hypothetical protein
MFRCPQCPDSMECVARSPGQRMVYSVAYVCPRCGYRLSLYHRIIGTLFINNYRFIFSRYSHCITCGSGSVARSNYADSLAKHPLGWIQRLIGAPMLECSSCGGGYFDWRSPQRRRSPAVSVTSADTAGDLAALSRALGQEAPGSVLAESNQPADFTVPPRSASL